MENIFKKISLIFILICCPICYSLSQEGLFNKCRQVVRKINKSSLTASAKTETPFSSRFYIKEVFSFNIPRSNQESEFYRIKGYDESSYKGIDEIIYYGILGAQLKEAGVDPERTHIEDLARMVLTRLNWFGEVLVALRMYVRPPGLSNLKFFNEFYNMNQKKEAGRLDKVFDIFDDFVKEAQERVHQRRVTYRWFNQWSHRLAMLASVVEDGKYLLRENQWISHAGFEKLLNSRQSLFRERKMRIQSQMGLEDLKNVLDNFPREIIFYMPGEIGIIALNYTEPTGVPIGLMNGSPLDFYGGKRKPTDGIVLSSVIHSAHDLRHHRDGFGKLLWSRNIKASVSKAEFKTLFIDKVRQMPQEQGYQAHLGFFLLNHEFGRVQSINIHNREEILQMVLSKLDIFEDGAFRNLLPVHIIKEKSHIENYLRETADVFSDVIDQIESVVNSDALQ